MKSGFVVLGSKNDHPPLMKQNNPQKTKKQTNTQTEELKKNKKTRKLEGALGLQSQSLRLRKKKR